MVLLGLGGVLAYYVYQKFMVVPEALTAIGEATGGAVYEFFHPNAAGETLFYMVNFSNGKHSIPASTVDASGRFTYRGAKFVMKDRRQPDGTYAHWAFAG
jgi:hypothetical protein